MMIRLVKKVSHLLYITTTGHIDKSCIRRVQRCFQSSKASLQHDVDLQKIRNIGIMAHIDAGKTTTTERMLYFSGLTKHLGDVDDGDTVTDYMEQERDRGITITAAAISFYWNKHKINLIDTPGHVDFTLEVERSLRVLDGAITVLDASAGVEAQTLTVWRQAQRYKIPRIIYLNKMDKPGADLDNCVTSVIEKLNTLPLVIQMPVGNGKNFQGVIDLVFLRKLVWNSSDDSSFDKRLNNNQYNVTALDKNTDSQLYEEAILQRAKLIEQLADLDEDIGGHILNDTNYEDIPAVDLMNALRRATLNQSGVPVLCGSSFKNRGVQPLMNSVVHFLPNPTERTYPFVQYYKDSLCALAFKTVHDKQRGALTFLRLYAGSVKSGSAVYNVNRECAEKCGKLLEIFADEHKEVQSAGVGSIVAVSGLKETITGDTLASSAQAARAAQKLYTQQQQHSRNREISFDDKKIGGEEEESDVGSAPVLAGLEVPDPVFMCSIEAPSLSAAKTLDHALLCLTKEDPSLRVNVNEDTGQTIISGMGELHLDIIRDRLEKEYGVKVFMGPLYIAYREAITAIEQDSYDLERTVGKTNHKSFIRLSIHPTNSDGESLSEMSSKSSGRSDASSQGRGSQPQVSFVPDSDSDLEPGRMRRDVKEAIVSGIKSALSRGPLLGFPIINARVEIHDFKKSFKTSLPMVSASAALCVKQVLQKSHCVLLQPMMSLQIDTDDDYVNTVLGDLAKRHGHIINVENHETNTPNSSSGLSKTVHANTPLSEMVGYATSLRTLTSGTASFTMQVSHYQVMDESEQDRVVRKS